MITPEQIKMAKAALGWSNTDLAEISGLHRNTINRAENGDARDATLALLKTIFEKGNNISYIEFISENGGGPGVRIQRK